MSPQCSEPELQTALLNEVRDGETSTPDLVLHLETCAACQTAVERLRRMTSAWTEDEVDESVIAAAKAEFYARRAAVHAMPGWLNLVSFASVGVAAGCLLLAASGTIHLPGKSRQANDGLPKAVDDRSVTVAHGAVETGAAASEPAFATTDDGAKWVRARPHVETAHGVAPLVNGLRLELKRGESARVALAEGRASQVEGPCLVEFWSTPLEVGGWRMVREDVVDSASVALENPAPTVGTSPRALPPASGSPPSRSLAEGVAAARDLAGPAANPVSAPAWARAATALREDDFDAADRAFDELGRASDATTRDAARLARAQLWISRGRGAAVRPVLEQLAQSGATALVRQRAAEFLNRDSH
jgi:hypothetical protein